MAYGNKTSDSGELRLRIRDSVTGSERMETVGTVRRSCGDRVRTYIRGQIEAKGISVRLAALGRKRILKISPSLLSLASPVHRRLDKAVMPPRVP
jgi:hypothetical protein